jgi:hypothetical protein
VYIAKIVICTVEPSGNHSTCLVTEYKLSICWCSWTLQKKWKPVSVLWTRKLEPVSTHWTIRWSYDSTMWMQVWPRQKTQYRLLCIPCSFMKDFKLSLPRWAIIVRSSKIFSTLFLIVCKGTPDSCILIASFSLFSGVFEARSLTAKEERSVLSQDYF